MKKLLFSAIAIMTFSSGVFANTFQQSYGDTDNSDMFITKVKKMSCQETMAEVYVVTMELFNYGGDDVDYLNYLMSKC